MLVRPNLFAILLATFIAMATTFAHPGSGIVVHDGQVYFIDTGKGVWKIDTQGRLVSHEGPALHFMSLDAAGLFRKTSFPRGRLADVRAVGSNPTLIVSSDYPLTVGRDGALYYPTLGRDERVQVIRMMPSGARTVLATLPGSTESGPLRWLNGMAAGFDGSVFYSENKAVRRITPDGTIATVANNVEVANCAGPPSYSSNNLGPHLRGLDVTSDGTVFVAATACSALLTVTSRGDVTPVLWAESPWSPTGVAVAGQDTYVLEYLHVPTEDRRDWTPRVRKIRPGGGVSVVATVTRNNKR